MLLHWLAIAKNELHQVASLDGKSPVVGREVGKVKTIEFGLLLFDKVKLVTVLIDDWIWVIGIHSIAEGILRLQRVALELGERLGSGDGELQWNGVT